jgi:RNA polymerase sigma factor (sigma-70 family)
MSDDLLRDDAALRKAFRRGDGQAMEAVYRAYHRLVRTVVVHGFGGFRGFRSHADQDDMIQTIFLSAFEESARLRYDGVGPYVAFLRGLAQNKVRQQLSKNTRFARTDGAPVPRDPMAEDFEGEVLKEETRAAVSAFREGITDPHEKAILEGYFIEGLAEESLASQVGMTRYKVRKVIAALHRRMEKHLREHDVLVY